MRYPAVAGRFYPSDKEELLRSIGSCFDHNIGPGRIGECSGDRRIVAAVAPHAGYMASGMCAAYTFKEIAEDGLPEAYIVIGPDHYGIPYEAVMCSEEYFTPLGACGIHEEIAEKICRYVPDDPSAHRSEHSIEVEVPFLQYIDPDPKIVPIIMGSQSIDTTVKLAEIIKDACKGHDVIVLASSDMSHYVPKDEAEKLDGMVLDRLAAKDVEGMYSAINKNKISVCGYGPMSVALLATEPSTVKVLKHTDSYDSLEYDRNSVVGYASAIMEK